MGDGGKRDASGSLIPMVGFVVLWLILTAAILVFQYPQVLEGAQTDADGYLRLVRVRLLMEEWDWFSGVIPRSNWPFGESLHWTRPLDILILVLFYPLRVVLSSEAALVVAGAVVAPLLHLALCLAGPWMAKPVIPGPARFLAMPALLVQLGILGYGNPGRADHHILVFLLVVLALGWWIRAVLDPEDVPSARIAGATSAVGVWVSPEALLPLAVILGSGAVIWILEGGRTLRSNRGFGEGLLGGILVALLLERPPREYLVVEFDRISCAHVTMALLVAVLWWVMDHASRRFDQGAGTTFGAWRRVVVGGAGGLAAALVLLLIHPGFIEGPWAEMDPDFPPAIIAAIPELQPLWPRDRAGLALFLIHMGPALLVAPFVALWSTSDRPPERRVWLLVGLGILVFFPLASSQIRLSGYLGIFSALAMVEVVQRGLDRFPARMSGQPLRRLGRATLMLAVLKGPLALGISASAALAGRDAPMEALHGSCSLPAIVPGLTDPEGLGFRPRTIAAAVAFGPELLYRTSHRVLGGPYHRNVQGVGDLFRLFHLEDEDQVLRLAQERELDLILLCPARDRPMLSGAGEGAFYHRLMAGRHPDWIRPVPLAEGGSTGFRLFRILPRP